MPPHRLLSHDLPTTVCTCVASAEEEEDELDQRQPQLTRHQVRKLRRTRRIDPQPILVEDEDDVEGEDEGEEEEEEDVEVEEDEEEMARQRHLYETAFDCKVNRSDDDLDDLDRVTNHPVLHSQVCQKIWNGKETLFRKLNVSRYEWFYCLNPWKLISKRYSVEKEYPTRDIMLCIKFHWELSMI